MYTILSYLYSIRQINIHDILDNHYYINLDHRTDRNKSLGGGLQKLIQTKDISKYALDQYWKILQKNNFLLKLY